MQSCSVFDDEQDVGMCRLLWKVQRQVESHESGRYEYFEYFVHQWIHYFHVTRHRCSCDWYSHGADGMSKTEMLFYQPSVDHLRLLVHTLEGMFGSIHKHQVVDSYYQNEV
jgi:hypothetical protein